MPLVHFKKNVGLTTFRIWRLRTVNHNVQKANWTSTTFSWKRCILIETQRIYSLGSNWSLQSTSQLTSQESKSLNLFQRVKLTTPNDKSALANVVVQYKIGSNNDIMTWIRIFLFTLLWRLNGCGGVSNHQRHDCLLSRLFRHRSKLRVTGLCEGNSPGTGEFPAQRASNAGNDSIWRRHHEVKFYTGCWYSSMPKLHWQSYRRWSWARGSNCIPLFCVDVITCPCSYLEAGLWCPTTNTQKFTYLFHDFSMTVFSFSMTTNLSPMLHYYLTCNFVSYLRNLSSELAITNNTDKISTT